MNSIWIDFIGLFWSRYMGAKDRGTCKIGCIQIGQKLIGLKMMFLTSNDCLWCQSHSKLWLLCFEEDEKQSIPTKPRNNDEKCPPTKNNFNSLSILLHRRRTQNENFFSSRLFSYDHSSHIYFYAVYRNDF